MREFFKTIHDYPLVATFLGLITTILIIHLIDTIGIIFKRK
jgi:hypothetical protein